ncbi:hypothetical protein DL89DRAFT_125951 [Linderina pennispora]|uniref:Uncharacterized protein n=1 Tax=Linderina pennispora TaxID=61395 RepID=A0A1Y1WD51_9FUNG|nr:uncharacterized protein DL89DRAFT_125951 [Linderina pennispora]ORX71450.1 hypothetical protein DL89DRAFT_125951 [Linderina pennispora]
MAGADCCCTASLGWSATMPARWRRYDTGSSEVLPTATDRLAYDFCTRIDVLTSAFLAIKLRSLSSVSSSSGSSTSEAATAASCRRCRRSRGRSASRRRATHRLLDQLVDEHRAPADLGQVGQQLQQALVELLDLSGRLQRGRQLAKVQVVGVVLLQERVQLVLTS